MFYTHAYRKIGSFSCPSVKHGVKFAGCEVYPVPRTSSGRHEDICWTSIKFTYVRTDPKSVLCISCGYLMDNPQNIQCAKWTENAEKKYYLKKWVQIHCQFRRKEYRIIFLIFANEIQQWRTVAIVPSFGRIGSIYFYAMFSFVSRWGMIRLSRYPWRKREATARWLPCIRRIAI